MFSFFKKKEPAPDLSLAPKDFSFLGADMHSHLVPGIDDGAPDLETSLQLIRGLHELGFKKLITTPHTHLDFYDNTREKITDNFTKLNRFITDHRLGLELGIASEYFLDSLFQNAILPHGLLSFGDKYVLVEVSMAGWPRGFSDIIFGIQSLGYTPVLAHPERYLFEEDVRVYQEHQSRGMLFALNLLSLSGYYGTGVQHLAESYLKSELYQFCGTDLHHERHLSRLRRMATNHPEIMLKLAEYPHWRNTQL
ncbi:MAG: histidinol phosphatase [Bacteroidetes bacterium]|nr:histidinol phosphatase [Bacteroidota bacterium]